MALISNCAEGGTSGTTPSSSNSGGVSGTALTTQTIGSGCTLTFDTAAAYAGALGYRYVQPSGSLSNWQLLTGLNATGRVVLRFWYRLDSVPTVVEYVCSFRSSAAQVCVLTIGTDGKFVMQNSAGVGITSGANGSAASSKATNAISANTWYRVEVSATKGTGTTDGKLEYAYYLGDSTTAEFAWTGTTNVNAGTANITGARIGRTTAANEARTADYDGLFMTELASGWVGPDTVIAPSGIASAETVGTPFTTPTLTVSPSGLASAEAVGTAAVSTLLTVSPAGIGTAAALGTPAIQSVLSITPAGASSGEAFGAAALSSTLTVSPAAVASTEAFGTATVSNDGAAPVTVSPAGLASAEAVGSPAVTLNLPVSPGGIGTAEAVGTPALSTTLTITPAGGSSDEAFGTAAITNLPPALAVAPTSIPSAAAFGTPVISTLLEISRAGLGTLEAFGTPVIHTLLRAFPASVPSAETFGAPAVTGLLTVHPAAIGTGEALGVPGVSTVLAVAPEGLASEEAFGTAALSGRLVGQETVSIFLLACRYGGSLTPGAVTTTSQIAKRWGGSLG